MRVCERRANPGSAQEPEATFGGLLGRLGCLYWGYPSVPMTTIIGSDRARFTAGLCHVWRLLPSVAKIKGLANPSKPLILYNNTISSVGTGTLHLRYSQGRYALEGDHHALAADIVNYLGTDPGHHLVGREPSACSCTIFLGYKSCVRPNRGHCAH